MVEQTGLELTEIFLPLPFSSAGIKGVCVLVVFFKDGVRLFDRIQYEFGMNCLTFSRLISIVYLCIDLYITSDSNIFSAKTNLL